MSEFHLTNLEVNGLSSDSSTIYTHLKINL